MKHRTVPILLVSNDINILLFQLDPPMSVAALIHRTKHLKHVFSYTDKWNN